MTDTTDTLFDSQPSGEETPFEFNDDVASVFPDMLNRSIPGYATTLSTIAAITGRYAQPGSRCYDLGCSLGGATIAMRRAVPDPTVTMIGIDNAPAMVKRCRAAMALEGVSGPVQIDEGDIATSPLHDASVIVLNFTLQFVPIAQRTDLLKRCADALRPGGVLLLSEKIAFDDPASDELFADLYHAFKRSQGYSQLEISRKRNALENVLIRETLDTHKQRLLGTGFRSVEVWFKCFNFASLIAFK